MLPTLSRLSVHEFDDMVRSSRGFLSPSILGLIRAVKAAIPCVALLGCFAVSEEGQRLSVVGGDLILSGRSSDIVNQDLKLGPQVQLFCGRGTAAVYPLKGDVSPPIGDGSATHHLILRCSKGDFVIRLRHKRVGDKYAVVDSFSPKRLRYVAGWWSVER